MARLQFELPPVFSFSTEIPLNATHINCGGHLDSAMLLTLVSEARGRFFRANEASETDTDVLRHGGHEGRAAAGLAATPPGRLNAPLLGDGNHARASAALSLVVRKAAGWFMRQT